MLAKKDSCFCTTVPKALNFTANNSNYSTFGIENESGSHFWDTYFSQPVSVFTKFWSA